MRIRRKFFLVAAVLVLATTAVAIFSLDRISRVNKEVVTLAMYHAPLSRILSDIEIHARNQEIALHKLLRSSPRMEEPGSSSSDPLTAIKSEGRLIDEGTNNAIRLAKEGIEKATLEQDRLKFAGLEPIFELINKEHQDFETAVLALASDLQARKALPPGSLSLVAKEMTDLNAALDSMTRKLDAMTETSSAEAARQQDAALRFNVIATVLSGLIGVLLAYAFSRSLSRPIGRLVKATEQVQKGVRDIELHVTSNDEVGTLTTAFNSMVRDLRAKERIKETLGKYIDPKIVAKVIEQTDAGSAKGERREMTVMFTDMKGFTSLSEELMPSNLVVLLNRYLSLMSAPVTANLGVVDKYIGDAVMAFWGPPFTEERAHAALACVAALAQVTQLDQLRSELPELIGRRKGLPLIDIHIGISTGEVVVGAIGSEITHEYTVIGDTVNVGSRLESLNKEYGTRILLCDATRLLAGERFEVREVDTIRVVGKEDPIRVFELLGEKGKVADSCLALRDEFERGLALYRDRRWQESEQSFVKCLQITPDDKCSQLFLERLRQLAAAPPSDWDGVWRFTTK